MANILNQIVIGSHDPGAQAAPWAQILGWPVISQWNDGSFRLEAPGGAGPRILFEPVPDSKTDKNRLHLDVEPREVTFEQQLERLLALGARQRRHRSGRRRRDHQRDTTPRAACVLWTRYVEPSANPANT